ncbi:hypothetical protein AT302_26850 [Pandoraea norimbergensis]|uniref:Uncharacterized protein n=1 Tax=Pandoraea norimbergensis TaxID=93219 RepID=A0ABN4JNP9_9BURK|nr:hypothetical protein AT302_26850 [Pandoraea norimbergensis]
MLREFNAVIVCAGGRGGDSVVAVPGACDRVVKTRDRAVHENACRGASDDAAAARVAIADANDSCHGDVYE